MSQEPPFDALAEAERQWRSHDLDKPGEMHAVIAIVHAHQLVTTAIDRALRPLDITFARYEVLMLLGFSKTGALPITKVGERLLVHPTGITRLVDKLEHQGLVSRQVHPEDRRSTLVRIESAGRRLAERATDVLVDLNFGVSLDQPRLQTLIDLLSTFRADFDTT